MQATPDRTRDVTTLVSIMGVRRPNRETGDPALVEVRLRIHNLGDVPIFMDPNELVLVSAGLETFAQPRLNTQETLAVEPRRSTALVALFPFPEGKSPRDVDLSSLNLSWTFTTEGRIFPQSVTLTRDTKDDYYRRYYWYPYGYDYYPYYGFGYPYYGFGYHHYPYPYRHHAHP